MAECRKWKKARSSFNWLFSDANLGKNEVIQRKVNFFISSLCFKEYNKMFQIINDIYNKKKID
jgi:hypothetical protein